MVMHKKMRRVGWMVLVLATLAGCTNADRRDEGKGSAVSIMPDYTVWGEEGKEVTCRLQFKSGGRNGENVRLRGDAGVSLDGKVLAGDSTRMGGVYYEVQQPIDAFRGKHTIVYTAANKESFREEFEFEPFSLQPELPAVIPRNPFRIGIRSLADAAGRMRLVITDTSFRSPDINEIVPVVNGEIEITSDMLDQLSIGPMSLELYREEERPLQEKTKKGGRIAITYVVKREFELVR